MILQAVVGGFVLDALFGDPAWLVHPVVIMGKAITVLEKFLRKRLPNTPEGERLGGRILAMALPVGTLLITGGVCWLFYRISPILGFAIELLWCAQALAAKGLAQESTNVYRELVKGDLPASRRAVSRIVGRDTAELTSEGVTKAAVETVAENASDGVIAPLFYMMLGGAPLADSAFGYYFRSYLPVLVAAAIASTPLGAALWRRLPQRAARVLGTLAILAGLALCTAYLVAGTYNPFLYFRF